MQNISLQITSSTDNSTLTLKTVGTNWGSIDIASLFVKVYGEDKDNALYSYELSAEEIVELQDTIDGLQAATETLIPDYLTNDNFYSLTVEGEETDENPLLSNSVTIGRTR